MNRTLPDDVQYRGGDLEISQCVWCRHRSAGGRTCGAYPDGIPDAISTNRHDHRTPYAADNGVRFAPEVVEIEFVGVEAEADFVPLSAELAIAMARTDGESQTDDEPCDPSGDTAEIIDLEGPSFELDGEFFDLGDVVSG